VIEEDLYLAPDPAALVDSLRAFPYSASTAIADLIDNSITAGARVIRIFTKWNEGNPTIEIVDDGSGMTETQLQNALTFAGAGPGAHREITDLGRFGLGLKTASLSQCSRMMVTTIRDGVVSNLGWDVDELRVSRKWLPSRSSPDEVIDFIKLLNKRDGTVVSWQKLDRLLGIDHMNQSIEDLDEVFEKVQDYLEMVFHRFMRRVAIDRANQLTIFINDQQLTAWDPFLEEYPVADQIWKVEDQDMPLPSGISRIIGYVLPTEREAVIDGAQHAWEQTGRKRWNKLQGFYVYRLDRLLSIGGYLDLGRLLDEHSKLARIAIELDNNTDNDWLLDVTKSSVTPPVRARRQLEQVARKTCSQATKRFRSRVKTFCKSCGKRPCVCEKQREIELVWHVPDLYENEGKFLINDRHSLLERFSTSLDTSERKLFKSILKLISKTIPIAFLRSVPADDEGMRGLSFRDDHESSVIMKTLVNYFFKQRVEAGDSLLSIKETLEYLQPFCDYPDIIEEIYFELQQPSTSKPQD
jgi:hypothetical protein